MIRSKLPRRFEVVGTSCLIVLGLSMGCGPDPAASRANGAAPQGRFTDVTLDAGIVHVHEKPVLDPKLDNIGPWVSSVGAAAAAGDYDRDGDIDLYVTNSGKGTPNFLYRNNGNGTFTDVAAVAGLAEVNDEGGVSMDCIWADVDNDGWSDLYLVRWGRDLLFRNNGNGTFSDVTAKLFRDDDGKPGTGWHNGNAVIALDYDLDGRLDLYVGNYFREVDLWNLDDTRIMHDDFEVARNAGRNQMYHQRPDGTFVEVAAELGLADTGWTLAVGSADLNNDGYPDLYIANDFGPDQLFYNDRNGGFRNVSDIAIGPDTRKGMNVDFGDFNNDGWMDIYVTNITTAEYLQEGNMLWRNNGPGADGLTRFMDISPESGTYDGGWGWGAKFLDYDNDADLDLFTVNGFISAGAGNYWYDLASWTVLDKDPADARSWPTIGDRSFSGYEKFRLWRNDQSESFREVAGELGVDSDRDGRGVVCLDYDDDGDTDLFVANQGQRPQLFRNDGAGIGHWLEIQLVGDPNHRTSSDAVGARVTVVTGDVRQIRERDGGTGYAGQSDPRLHFGLGGQARVDLLEVRWPDGGVQYLEDVPADRRIAIRQDPAEYAARPRVDIETPLQLARDESLKAEVPEIDPQTLDRLLTTMEHGLRLDPANHSLAHTYRRRCADYGRHDRAIAFFTALVEARPTDRWSRLELSVALVDKIPVCGGLAAIVCKGTLARRSLDQLDAALASDPNWWVGRYARGMNHLHWPRALRHTQSAIEDFGACVELQRAGGDPRAEPYYERTYALLGDAYAKHHAFDEARRIWRAGLELFPESRELQRRVGLSDDETIREFVESQRSLEQAIDTDFSFLGDLR